MNLKFWQRKSNTERQLEALEAQIGELFDLTAAVPGDTLRERILNLLPPKPLLYTKSAPPLYYERIEAV
jgi:hypothetical protein